MFEEGSTSRNVGYFIPGVGTYLSVLDAIKDPSWQNIGNAALSGVGDALTIFGVGTGIKGLVAANKASLLITKGNKILKVVLTTNKWTPKILHFNDIGRRMSRIGLNYKVKANRANALSGIGFTAKEGADTLHTKKASFLSNMFR